MKKGAPSSITYPNGGDELSRASAQEQTDQEYRLWVRLNVTQLRDAILKARREQVIKLRKTGLSYAEIGRRLDLSRERVRQIAKQISAPKKSGPEFDVMLTLGEVACMLGVHEDTSDETLMTSLLKSLRQAQAGSREPRGQDSRRESFTRRTVVKV